MIEKEPITVVISEKGWIRGMKGHLADFAGLQFKDGDALKTAFHANTTDKLVIVTTGGKAYTLGADKLPGGRGQSHFRWHHNGHPWPRNRRGPARRLQTPGPCGSCSHEAHRNRIRS